MSSNIDGIDDLLVQKVNNKILINGKNIENNFRNIIHTGVTK